MLFSESLTGHEKIKVFEMNQTLLLQCRPCTGTCHHLIAKYETRATERYGVSEFRRPLRPCALHASTSLFAYGTETLRKPKQASSLVNLCKSATVNIDELVSCICVISNLNIEMGQALLPQCRPCTATCFAHLASYPTTRAY